MHHFFLARQAQGLACPMEAWPSTPDPRVQSFLLFSWNKQSGDVRSESIWPDCITLRLTVLSAASTMSLRRFRGLALVQPRGEAEATGQSLSGTGNTLTGSAISTDNLGLNHLPGDSVDYIFTDPPFGENIYYSDLNFLVEAWHGVRTNSQPEAIVDQCKAKTSRLSAADGAVFQQLLSSVQAWPLDDRRVSQLPKRRLERHPGGNLTAGFVVADVRTLDKQQGSFKQVTTTGAVKQDLVISAYKPAASFERRFQSQAGSETAPGPSSRSTCATCRHRNCTTTGWRCWPSARPTCSSTAWSPSTSSAA